AVFDSSGQMINGREILTPYALSTQYPGKNIFSDAEDNLYICIRLQGTVLYSDSTGSDTVHTGTEKTYIVKFSGSGQKFEWARTIPLPYVTTNIAADVHGNVYSTGYLYQGSAFYFAGSLVNPVPTRSGATFVFDKNGNEKSWF